MPKNATTIIKQCVNDYLASAFVVNYNEDTKDLMTHKHDTKTYWFEYGNGKVFLQAVKSASLYDSLMITLFDKNGNEVLCDFLSHQYKYKMQQLEDICKLLLDCTYMGFDIDEVKKGIEKIILAEKKRLLINHP